MPTLQNRMAAPGFTFIEVLFSVIIIGIGLWEAWKFTREVKVQFQGPFTVAT